MVLLADDSSSRQKCEAIKQALNKDPVDVITLKQLAISRGGLINDEIRKLVWPKLVDADVDNVSPKPGKGCSICIHYKV